MPRMVHTIAAVGTLLVGLGRTSAADATNREPLALWDRTLSVSAGGGYRDNVLRTSVAPESSYFFSSAADFSLIRLSENGSQWTFFALGEDIRYFDSPSVPKEQLFSGTAQYETPLGTQSRIGAAAQYFYQNQVVDVSETEVDLTRVLVEGHSFSFRPEWQYFLAPDLTLKLEGTMYRQIYVAELDDYWEGSGRLGLLYKYGHRSDLWVGYQSRHRLYDTRRQFDREGFLLPDTSLVYAQNEFGAIWRHYLDEKRHWRTMTKFGFLLSQDNGSGYFNYHRIQLAQQLRWQSGPWEIRAEARLGYYYYPIQRISGDNRERTYYILNFRGERRFGKHAFVFAGAEREWDFSNDPLDEYRDWMATAGIGIEF